MEIRLYHSSDLSSVCTLINHELGYAVTRRGLNETMQKMEKEEYYTTFVAVQNHQVVGFIGLQSVLAYEMEGRFLRIIALAVSEDEQKKGIGSKLVQRAIDYAKEQKACMVALNSGLNRTGAHQFYEKQGFYKKGYSFSKKIDD